MTDTVISSEVALIGGTGGMGSAVLHELTSRGVRVRAVVRREAAVPATDLVSPVLADAYDTAALTEAFRGVGTVVSAFNPGWDSGDLYNRYREGARAIRAAAIRAGVERLVVIGGASSLLDGEGHELVEHGLPPEPYGSGVRAARDLLVEMRLQESPDWVYVSPPMNCGPMGPKGRTGQYRLGLDHAVVDAGGTSSLSVEDLAVVVVDEVLDPRHHHARITAAY